jgi:hypothetical protein
MSIMQKLFDLFARKSLWAAALAAILFSAGPPLHAQHLTRCQRRTIHAEHELHEAIYRYGYASRQADRRRYQLHEAREHCWMASHRWWDEHAHRWHHEHDWDDHDHDHRITVSVR